jgi:hypothetical protein
MAADSRACQLVHAYACMQTDGGSTDDAELAGATVYRYSPMPYTPSQLASVRSVVLDIDLLIL